MSDTTPITRRTALGYGLGTVGGALLGSSALAACGSSGSSSTASTTSVASTTTVVPMGGAALLTAAKAEAELTTVAIGVEDSYYVPVIAAFETFSGINLDAQHTTYPPKSAVADLQTAKTAGNPPPYDVIEITQSTAEKAASEGLVTPYVSTLWTDIPSVFKDADGNWAASYFGLVSLITNTTVSKGFEPKSWDELASSSKAPKGAFAMLGDPRTGQPLEGGLGLLTVMSAALANDGSLDDVEPGLKLLGELVDKGIFDVKLPSSLVALPDTAGASDTPVKALYSFDLPLAQHSGKASQTTVVGNVPTDGQLVGFYPQAIAKGAPHPHAAKLWLEFLQSDQGAEVFLKNGAIPTRFHAISQFGSAKLKALLPPAASLNAPVPSISQITAAQKTVDDKWTTYIPTDD